MSDVEIGFVAAPVQRWAVMYKERNGKRGWSILADEDAAHSEARIHIAHGDIVNAISPINEIPDFPIFHLTGHDHDQTKRFAEIWKDYDTEKGGTCGHIAGFEVNLPNLQDLKEWLDAALNFLTIESETNKPDSEEPNEKDKSRGIDPNPIY